MRRVTALRPSLALLLAAAVALGPARARAGVTSEQVERAIREGVRFLLDQQQEDGSWTEAEAQVKTGTTSLVTLALLTAGEKLDSPKIQPCARVPPWLRAAAAPQHLRHRPADHGLRRRRARDRPPAASGERQLAGAGPDQARGPRALAGNVDVLRGQVAGRRPFQHPVCPPRPQRRQRGRRRRQARGLGAVPGPLRAVPEPRRRLGLHAPPPPVDRQHDLRRHLQPDHRRLPPLRGPGVPPGRVDPRLRPRRHQPPAQQGARLARQPVPGRPEHQPGPGLEVLLPLRDGARRAAWPASGSSARTTGIAWAPRSWSTTRTRSPASGAGPTRRTSWSRPASRCCSWPRAARRC